MSSGIHACLEIRGSATLPPVQWLCVAPDVLVDEPRNRKLFVLLRGERIVGWNLAPLVPPRGLPSDVTWTAKAMYDTWGGMASDAGWVSYEELVQTVEHMRTTLHAFAREQGKDDILHHNDGASITAVIAFLAVYRSRGFDTRMVFWSTPI